MEDIRNNLVEYLANDENRKEYLHGKSYTLWEIINYAYAPLKENNNIKLLMLIRSFAEGILPLVSSFIVYYLVSELSKNDVIYSDILKITITYALIYSLASIVGKQIFFRTYTLFSRLRMEFLHKCGSKMMTMDLGLLENSEFLTDASRFHHAFQSNNNGLEGTYHKIFDLGGQLISLILLGILLIYLSPLIIIASIATIGILVYFRKVVAEYKHKRVDSLNDLNRKLGTFNREASDFKYGKDLRLYNFKEIYLKAFKPITSDYVKYYRQYTKPVIYIAPLTALMVVGLEAISYYYLTIGILNEQIDLATITLLITALTLFIFKLNEVAQSISFIKEEIFYFKDGIDFLETDLVSSYGDIELDAFKNLDIEFKNVSFSYPGTDKLVLKDLNFKIKAGERLALVGINGAGKTTVVKLITGLYKPTSGEIYLNDINAKDVDIASGFRAFSVVLQEVEPLAMTIAENISASKDNIDREKVMSVLAQVGLSEKIKTLKNGIDTPMTKILDEDGAIFSGGENQKLAIARALYKESAKVLIMDEPTAALDALAEEKIYKELDEIVGDKTLVFISHRLASTRFCDKIALLDGGRIAESGTLDELMELKGIYWEMFETQGKYYREQEEQNE